MRALRGAWVQPALGEPYLAIGLDLYDTGPQSIEAVRAMMQQTAVQAPAGVPVSTVAMADEYDQVAMWMRACSRPFFDRDAFAGTQAMPAPATGGWPASGYSAAPQQGWRPRPY